MTTRTFRGPALVALALLASCDGLTAGRDSGASTQGAKSVDVHPAEILRRVAAGADSLVVETSPLPGEEKRKLLEVTDRAALAELLGLIDTPPLAAGSFMHHLCVGHPKMRFSKRGKVLAEISLDHASVLRPYSKELWGDSDVNLTEASARAVAKWFARQGHEVYQRELDARDKEGERWRAFHAAFPPKARESLTTSDRGIDWALAGALQHADCTSETLAPLSSEIPDPVERARVIFRALGGLGGYWSSYTQEEAKAIGWAACIPPRDLLKAIDLAMDVAELRGAARVLFGAPIELIDSLDRPVAERLALKVAPAVLADADNARSLTWRLASFKSKAATRMLGHIAARATEATDSPCGSLSRAPAALSALVILAERRAADAKLVRKAAAHAWQCGANRSAARIAAALVADRLPDEEDVKEADATSALMTLERLKSKPTPAAEQLARGELMSHPWAVVRNETRKWLAHLTRAQLNR